jgi:hypothetical protein
VGEWWKYDYSKKNLFGAGTQTAGLAAGGTATSSGDSNATEEYNGSTWGPGGNLATAKNISRRRNTNSRTCIWWLLIPPGNTASNSTEEYGGYKLDI